MTEKKEKEKEPEPEPKPKPEPKAKTEAQGGREGEAPLFVIDASALLAAFLPEEEWEAQADALLTAYQEGRIRLAAPSLLPYEVLNSLYLAVRGKAGRPPRLREEEAQEAWAHFQGLRIPLLEVEEVAALALTRAIRHRWRSLYDLAYVAWAERLNTKLISADPALIRTFPERTHPLWEPLPHGG